MQHIPQPDWRPGPERPRLVAPGVDVWRIDLAPANGLDAASAQRAQLHQILRRLLGRYLDLDPAQLQLVRDPGGKPRLDMPGLRLEFNLSHCRSCALIAFSDTLQVGIDVEALRPLSDPLRIARRVFERDELEALARCESADRLALFFELWTAMEARQKALGRGIFDPPVARSDLACFAFRPGPAQFAGLAVASRTALPRLRFFACDQA